MEVAYWQKAAEKNLAPYTKEGPGHTPGALRVDVLLGYWTWATIAMLVEVV